MTFFAKGDLVKVLTPTKSRRNYELSIVHEVVNTNNKIIVKPVSNQRIKHTITDITQLIKTSLSNLEHNSRTRTQPPLNAPPAPIQIPPQNLRCLEIMQSTLNYVYIKGRAHPLVEFLKEGQEKEKGW